VTDIEWVDAPPERRNCKPPAYGFEALDALKANPGKWAKLHHYPVKQTATSALAPLRKKGYEAEARQSDTGSGGDLYARWPDTDDHGEPVEPTPIRRNPSARAKTTRLPYVCDDCDADFSTPSALSHHASRQHAS